MRWTALAALAACIAFAAVPAARAADGPPEPRKARVSFAKGASSATVRGTLKGDGDVDYVVRAAAGQTLEVTLQGSNRMNDFNVLPPGSANVAMFSSFDAGVRTHRTLLPADGDYAIRVYLARAAARRNETSRYALTVAVTGQPLPPLPAARDAKVPGTPYHATATVPCVVPFQPNVSSCEAGVVRRGNDGTATVDASGGNGWKRSILFVHGKPVVTDAMAPLAFSRQGDVTTVKVGDDERYEIPDAFINGG